MKRSANFQKGKPAKRAKTTARPVFKQNKAVIGKTFIPEMKSMYTVYNSAITSGTGSGGDTDYLGAVTNSVRSNRNVDLTKRYQMLWKKNIPLRICGTVTGALACNGAAFQANQDDLFMEFHKEVDLITQFNAGNTGSVADIENGALIFCWWTDLGAGLPTSSFDVNIRIRYYD